MIFLTTMLPVLPLRGVRVATENTAVAGVAGVASFLIGPLEEIRKQGRSASHTHFFDLHGYLSKSGNSGNTGNTYVIASHSVASFWQQTGNTGNTVRQQP